MAEVGSSVHTTRQQMLYLAVVPEYRIECFSLLRARLPELLIVCSPAHLDPSVRTGLPDQWWTEARMLRLLGRAFLQVGHWRQAIQADDLVVDLNPRSLNAWLFLATRRVLQKRTIVWGHLYPQDGPISRTRGLRRVMRRLSSGALTYTYANAAAARRDMPDQRVWVAPNSLYSKRQLERGQLGGVERTDAVYVGRLEPAKKVDLLVSAFAASGLAREGARLVIVGGGSQEEALRKLASDLDVDGAVDFRGWMSEFDALAETYSHAFVANSPGFAGLGLTQALGFGVPMIIARGEPHSPEIELATSGAAFWVASDDVAEYATALVRAFASRDGVPVGEVAANVASKYSAERMAEGLQSALMNHGGTTSE